MIGRSSRNVSIFCVLLVGPRGFLSEHSSEMNSEMFITQDILRLADGLIVARGELGQDLGAYAVPLAQKALLRAAGKAKARAKAAPEVAGGQDGELLLCEAFPVMVSTQLMESMIENPTPTRAEVNDVLNGKG